MIEAKQVHYGQFPASARNRRADDRGDAVRGDHFDLAVPTHSEALELGVKYATVYWYEEGQ